MTRDPWNDADAQQWLAHVRKTLIPMIDDSELTISLAPRGETDIKFAVELGLSIMFNKPILAVIGVGQKIPPKLAQVADMVVEIDLADPTASVQIQSAITAMMKEIKEP